MTSKLEAELVVDVVLSREDASLPEEYAGIAGVLRDALRDAYGPERVPPGPLGGDDLDALVDRIYDACDEANLDSDVEVVAALVARLRKPNQREENHP